MVNWLDWILLQCFFSPSLERSLEIGWEPRYCVCLFTWVMSFISTSSQTERFLLRPGWKRREEVGPETFSVCVHSRLAEAWTWTNSLVLRGDTHTYRRINNLTAKISIPQRHYIYCRDVECEELVNILQDRWSYRKNVLFDKSLEWIQIHVRVVNLHSKSALGHCGLVVRPVASQQEGPGLDSQVGEFSYYAHVCIKIG